MFGRSWPQVGQFRHNNLAKFGPMLSTSCHIWYLLGQLGPTSGPKWPQVAAFGDVLAKLRQKRSIGPKSARIGRHWADLQLPELVGQLRSSPGSPKVTFRGEWRATVRQLMGYVDLCDMVGLFKDAAIANLDLDLQQSSKSALQAGKFKRQNHSLGVGGATAQKLRLC